MGEDSRGKILFVCTGNTCRSPIAEAVFKCLTRLDEAFRGYEVLSAGILAEEGQRASDGSLSVLKSKHIDLDNHRSRRINQDLIDQSAAIICATEYHEKFLRNSFVNLPKICTSFSKFGGDIADPYGGDLDNYREITDKIEQQLPLVIDFLRKELDDH